MMCDHTGDTEARPDAPRPTKMLLAASVAVMAGSLWIVSLYIGAAVAEADNPLMVAGAMVLVPLFLALAIVQYRGTFRRKAAAARVTRIILYGLGGFLAFGFICNVGEALVSVPSLQQMQQHLDGLVAVFIVGLVAAAFLVTGRMNSLWMRELQAAVDEGYVGAPAWRFSLREVLAWFTIVTVVFGFACYVVRSTPPRFAEHVAAAATPIALPAGATDVCYYRGIRGFFFAEFSTDEQGFRDWVAAEIGWGRSQAAGSTP